MSKLLHRCSVKFFALLTLALTGLSGCGSSDAPSETPSAPIAYATLATKSLAYSESRVLTINDRAGLEAYWSKPVMAGESLPAVDFTKQTVVIYEYPCTISCRPRKLWVDLLAVWDLTCELTVPNAASPQYFDTAGVSVLLVDRPGLTQLSFKVMSSSC